MTQEEQELVWVARKVEQEEDLVKRMEEYFDEHQSDWSRGVFEHFLLELEQLKDQLYFKQSRLERLTWKVVDERERRHGRDSAYT